MDFFLLVDLILYFLIISHSYRLICKGQINRKEFFVFGAYTLLTDIVFDFPFYLLNLDGLGIETFFISFILIFLFSMDETV